MESVRQGGRGDRAAEKSAPVRPLRPAAEYGTVAAGISPADRGKERRRKDG